MAGKTGKEKSDEIMNKITGPDGKYMAPDFGHERDHLTQEDLMHGKPAAFDVDKFCDAVEMMCSADEPIRALQMLNNMPGYYREFEPARVTELRKLIEERFYLPAQYADHCHEEYEDSERLELFLNPTMKSLSEKINCLAMQPRAEVIVRLVQKLNEQGKMPYIVEFGPSDYWLPLGLKHWGCKFSYYAYSLNKRAEESIKPHLEGYWITPGNHDKDAPYIYVCCEVLEHLFNEEEMKLYSQRLDKDPDHVVISTPRNSYMGGKPKWKDWDCEHIRTYTPKEFVDLAKKFWPNLTWELFLAPSQVLWGKK